MTWEAGGDTLTGALPEQGMLLTSMWVSKADTTARGCRADDDHMGWVGQAAGAGLQHKDPWTRRWLGSRALGTGARLLRQTHTPASRARGKEPGAPTGLESESVQNRSTAPLKGH